MPSSRAQFPLISWFGLALALFGIPLVTNGFRFFHGAPRTSLAFLGKEALVLGMTGLLLLVVVRGEGRPLSSIGLHARRIQTSLAWGLLGAVMTFAAMAGVVLLEHFLLRVPDGGPGPARWMPPLPILVVMLLRAGLCEEICFRGYAIERLQELTGSRLVASGVPLGIFILSHFNLGREGIALAAAGGLALTVLYLLRRDLLANIVAHAIVDLVPNVLGVLLGRP